MRNSILAQVIDQSARARLSNLALVKPEKANAVENYLIQMARFGKLGGKISESGSIEILEKVIHNISRIQCTWQDTGPVL
uniref:Programmed cell death 5 n=1 Tax=Stegastes partitus TaxID=144197 RepID=A0A3B4ZHH8_9TELE